MAQFDYFKNSGGEGFLVDIQADLLDYLTTRVVVPLLPAAQVPPSLGHLHPRFEIGGVSFVLATQLLTAIPANELRDRSGNLARHRDDIVRAIDTLLIGV